MEHITLSNNPPVNRLIQSFTPCISKKTTTTTTWKPTTQDLNFLSKMELRMSNEYFDTSISTTCYK